MSRVSIIIVNYNGREHLGRCLSSVLDQDCPDCEVILVDNDSTDGSAEYVQREFGGVKLIRAAENLGFGRANNLAAQQATGEYLAFLNPDTAVETNWLRPLVRALQCDPKAGLVTPKILLLSRPDRINTCGNDVHLTGIPACRGWMMPTDAMDRPEEVCSVSGAAFVIRKSIFEEIGGFDETFFLYAEDNDLSWRALLAGYRCLYVPGAVIYHEYVPRFGPDKYYYLERNRYQMLVKNLRWRTLALLLPALALTEVITWGFAVFRGWRHVLAKLRSYAWLVRNWAGIRQSRRRIQSHRKARDRDILSRCNHALAYDLAGDGAAARLGKVLFDPLFLVWHRICVTLIVW